MPKEFSVNYKEFNENYKGMKRDMEFTNKDETEMKNAIPEMYNTPEGTKIRLDKAEDRIRDLEDNVQKTTSQAAK